MSEQDDGYVTIRARVRIDADGNYMIRDTDECGSIDEFNENWDQFYDLEDNTFNDGMIEIRIRPPKRAVAEVTLPDAPEPATAGVVA